MAIVPGNGRAFPDLSEIVRREGHGRLLPRGPLGHRAHDEHVRPERKVRPVFLSDDRDKGKGHEQVEAARIGAEHGFE